MVKPSYSRKAAADTARPGAGRGIVEQADIDPAAATAEISSLVRMTPPNHLDADSSYQSLIGHPRPHPCGATSASDALTYDIRGVTQTARKFMN